MTVGECRYAVSVPAQGDWLVLPGNRSRVKFRAGADVVELVSGDALGRSARFEQIAPLGVFGLVDLASGEPVVQGAQSIRSASSGQ